MFSSGATPPSYGAIAAIRRRWSNRARDPARRPIGRATWSPYGTCSSRRIRRCRLFLSRCCRPWSRRFHRWSRRRFHRWSRHRFHRWSRPRCPRRRRAEERRLRLQIHLRHRPSPTRQGDSPLHHRRPLPRFRRAPQRPASCKRRHRRKRSRRRCTRRNGRSRAPNRTQSQRAPSSKGVRPSGC